MKEKRIKLRLMKSESFNGPVNIGSDEMISINGLAEMAIKISGKKISINNLQGQDFEKKYGHKCPIGVNGRNSDNALISKELGWSPYYPLIDGMNKAYEWINKQYQETKREELSI